MGVFFNKIAIFYETFRIIKIINFNRAEPTCYKTYFPYASSGLQNGAFRYIILRVMHLTYTRSMIQFSNRGGLSQMVILQCNTVMQQIESTVGELRSN